MGDNSFKKDNDNYIYDVETGSNFIKELISKIKKNKNQKLLTSGNLSIKYTNESINSLLFRASIKAKIIKTMDSLSKMFDKAKVVTKNKYEPVIIGKPSANSKQNASEELPDFEDKKLSDVAPIVPKAISKTIAYNNSSEQRSSEEDSK